MKKNTPSHEISKSLISITNMSACCEILEIILNKELKDNVLFNNEDDILNTYNERKSQIYGENYKNVSLNHINSQIRLLRNLEFVDNFELTSLGKKVASHCANGEYDQLVTYHFFKNFYKNCRFFRETIQKIRETSYNLDEIIAEISKKHGLNKYAISGLKSWIKSLNFTYLEGNIIKIDPLFEMKALDFNLLSDFHVFLTHMNPDRESFIEENLLSESDLNFFNGTISNSIMNDIILRMSKDGVPFISTEGNLV